MEALLECFLLTSIIIATNPAMLQIAGKANGIPADTVPVVVSLVVVVLRIGVVSVLNVPELVEVVVSVGSKLVVVVGMGPVYEIFHHCIIDASSRIKSTLIQSSLRYHVLHGETMGREGC